MEFVSFFNVLGTSSGQLLDVVLINSCSSLDLAGPSNMLVFSTSLHVPTIQKNIISIFVHHLFRYQFGYWFLIRFSIDLGSTLAPHVALNSMLFCNCVFEDFVDCVLINSNETKM